jgi:hypothetical protein
MTAWQKARVAFIFLLGFAAMFFYLRGNHLGAALEVSRAEVKTITHDLDLATAQLNQERVRAMILNSAIQAQTAALAEKVKREERYEIEKKELLRSLDAALDATPETVAWADGACPVCVAGRGLRR